MIRRIRPRRPLCEVEAHARLFIDWRRRDQHNVHDATISQPANDATESLGIGVGVNVLAGRGVVWQCCIVCAEEHRHEKGWRLAPWEELQQQGTLFIADTCLQRHHSIYMRAHICASWFCRQLHIP